MSEDLKIHDIIINDDPKFDISLSRATHFINQMINRIEVKSYEQFKTMFDGLQNDFLFRLWVHLGILNNPDPKTYKGVEIKKNILGSKKLKNIKFQFLTRETQSDTEFDDVALINIEKSVSEDFKIDIFPVNKKAELIKTFAEAKAKENLNYVGGDPNSAIEKAKKVLDVINEHQIDLSNYAFISLGGGDGTELFYEIEKSQASVGYIIEYDGDSNDRFDNLVNEFKDWLKPRATELSNREADLFDKHKFEKLKEFIEKKNLEGIVVTVHAVLHELGTRSKLKQKFDLVKFFKRIAELHPNIFLVIREPGIAENWSENVKIKVQNKIIADQEGEFVKKNMCADNDEILNKIFEELKAKYFQDEKHQYNYNVKIKEFTSSRDLAIEALTKLFYLQDFYYEIGEQQTSISRVEIQEALIQTGFSILESEAIGTTSVKINFKKFQIKVFEDDEKKLLPRPLCFSYTIATKGIHKMK